MQPAINKTPARPRSSAAEVTPPAQLDDGFRIGRFLFQVLLCIVPVGAILATGRASAAGYLFWGLFGLSVLRLVTCGKHEELLCLLLALAPFINLLRAFAFYNVIVGAYGAGLIFHMCCAPSAWRTACRAAPLINWIFLCVGAYYAISLYNTRDYSTNLRLFELAFTVAFVLTLARKPAYLQAAFCGLIMSACVVGISMLPFIHSDAVSRLGLIEIEGRTLGNPTQLGVPLAFGFLALMVDRGQWLGVENNRLLRILLLACVLPLLALTSSRASWLVAAGGFSLAMLLGQGQRLKLLLGIGAALTAVQLVLISPYGPALQKGLERTFGEKRSVRQRTSGRSDQWILAYHVVFQSAKSMVCGYGPGTGAEVYAQHSLEVEGIKYGIGKKVAWHSLFMQIGVETGLLGLLLLISWLAYMGVKVMERQPSTGLLMPVICLAGYIFIVITVSGNDINSGVFLGIGLLGTLRG